MEVSYWAAATAQAYADLAKAQQEEISLQERINKYSESQSRMLRQELEALDKLDYLPTEAWVGFTEQPLP